MAEQVGEDWVTDSVAALSASSTRGAMHFFIPCQGSATSFEYSCLCVIAYGLKVQCITRRLMGDKLLMRARR